ncbi:SDR family oxidoreductase [Sphingomonas sp. PAMC 26605]|uniref:SDR family oxidoreductase n=1 Tax=Sphingomonas sp. PAMC 26605 TaxID=1112214 RepID=UPI00026CB1AD|nr:SDR family oxidoreductase [Sphingomonas sp. PAMC 26605]
MTEQSFSEGRSDLANRRLLVIGGHGVAGGAIVNAAVRDGGWKVMTAGRRASPEHGLTGALSPEHVSVDLLSATNAKTAFANVPAITDLVFAAYVERPSMALNVAPNVEMLINTLEALYEAGTPPGRVVLIGGGKSYGPHLGPYKTPAKESDHRILGPIFYDDQEDALREWSARNGASWSILRPDGILGVGLGSPMNLATGLAVYAAICREEGVPLRFPGTVGAWSALHQVTDAGILGDAALWALGAETARNEIFNVTNGDHYRWKHLWGDIASYFDIAPAEPQPMSLVTQMEDKGPVWERIVAKHGLRQTPWKEIAAWPFLDGVLGIDYDLVQSTIKIRQAGFADCIDTHASFIRQFDTLRTLKLVP